MYGPRIYHSEIILFTETVKKKKKCIGEEDISILEKFSSSSQRCNESNYLMAASWSGSQGSLIHRDLQQ